MDFSNRSSGENPVTRHASTTYDDSPNCLRKTLRKAVLWSCFSVAHEEYIIERRGRYKACIKN